jgi:hypothetical protein
MTMESTEAHVWIISRDSRALLEDAGGVVLNLRDGRFSGINATGVKLWKLLQHRGGCTRRGLVEQLATHGSDFRSLEEDVDRFLRGMQQRALITNASLPQTVEGSGISGDGDEANLQLPAGGRTGGLSARTLSPMWLFLLGFLGLITAKFILSTGGFSKLYSAVHRWRVRGKMPSSDISLAAAVFHAVDRAARFFPKRTWCLELAAAAVWILRWYGFRAEFVIGCRRLPFASHAWVELDNKPLNQAHDILTRYTVIARC